MLRQLLPVLAIVLALLVGMRTAQAEFVRLADGSVIQVTIDSASVDDDGITVTRLDNGGTFKLRWNQLAPEDRARLRQQYNLDLPDFRGMLTTLGDRVETLEGDVYEGRILEDEPGKPVVITFRDLEDDDPTKFDTKSIKREDIQQIFRDVQINALMLKTEQELYDQLMAENPPFSANDHYLMAMYCKHLGLYAEGLDHIIEAISLKPELADNEAIIDLQNLLQTLLDNEAFRIELDAAYKLMRRGKYGEAMAALDELQTRDVPDELLALVDEMYERLDQMASEDISKRWYRLIEVMAKRFLREEGSELTLGDARAYGQGQMNTDILNELADEFGLATDLIQQLFDARDPSDYREMKVSWDQAALQGLRGRNSSSNGNGSDDGGSIPDIPGMSQEDQERLRQRLRQMQNQGGGNNGGGSNQSGPSPDEMFAKMSTGSKADVIIASYCDRAGSISKTREEDDNGVVTIWYR